MVKKLRTSAPAASDFITLDLSMPQVMKDESQRLRIEQLQDALGLAERNSKARATFIKYHLLYYVAHTIVITLCLTGLGWLIFAVEREGAPEPAGLNYSGTDAQMTKMLLLASFWLHLAMLLVSALLGPLFQLRWLGSSFNLKAPGIEDRAREAAQTVIVITEGVLRLAIIGVALFALTSSLHSTKSEEPMITMN